MPQKLLFVDGVTVTPAVALPGNVRADLELGHDALYGPFGDPDPIGDIPEADPRILGEAKQDVCVVGQEGPVGNSMGHWATLRGQDKAGSRHDGSHHRAKFGFQRMMRVARHGVKPLRAENHSRLRHRNLAHRHESSARIHLSLKTSPTGGVASSARGKAVVP
jgi:hypothetical protein